MRPCSRSARRARTPWTFEAVPAFSEVRRSPGLVVGALVGIAVGFASAGAFGMLDAGLLGWCAGALAYMIVSALTMSKVDMQAVRARGCVGGRGARRAALGLVGGGDPGAPRRSRRSGGGGGPLSKTGDVVIALWRSSSPGSSSRSPSPSIMRMSFGWTASVSPSRRSAKPGFWDLLYVALTIGITYQSSDVADVQRGASQASHRACPAVVRLQYRDPRPRHQPRRRPCRLSGERRRRALP